MIDFGTSQFRHRHAQDGLGQFTKSMWCWSIPTLGDSAARCASDDVRNLIDWSVDMASIADFKVLVPFDHGLSTVAISRGDRAPQVTVVNAAVVDHPVTAVPVVAFVTAGVARKLTLLRASPAVAVTIRAGWQWVTVAGTAELIGPDDPSPDIDDEQLRLLLRSIFEAAGGTHIASPVSHSSTTIRACIARW
jgi:hypothetical protein